MTVRLLAQGYSQTVLNESAKRILASTKLLSLATTTSAGVAHINTAFFALLSNFRFIFLSDPATRHGENLARENLVAATIFDSQQDWFDDKSGLQLFGPCTPSPDQAESRKAYRKAFPKFGNWIDGLTEEERSGLTTQFYTFEPTRLTILDEAQFGEEVFVEVAIER